MKTHKSLLLAAGLVLAAAVGLTTANYYNRRGGARSLEGPPSSEVTLPIANASSPSDITSGSASAQSQPMVVVGQLEAGSCDDLQVDGGRLYAACGSDLIVYDISNAQQPAELGRFVGPHEIGAFTEVDSRYAYVVDAASRLHVIDVADPSNLSELSDTELPLGAVRDTDLSGNLLYVAEAAGTVGRPSGLRVIDVEDPSAPVQLDLRALSDVDGNAVSAVGGKIYLATRSSAGTGGLYIYDSAMPTALHLIASSTPGGEVTHVAVESERAYITVRDRHRNVTEMRVVDVQDSFEPVPVGSFTFPGTSTAMANVGYIVRDPLASPVGIVNAGSYVLTLESRFGVNAGESEASFSYFLRKISRVDPSHPQEVGRVQLPLLRPGSMAVSGNVAYVAGGGAGIFVVQTN
jgi:hypothetical protein